MKRSTIPASPTCLLSQSAIAQIETSFLNPPFTQQLKPFSVLKSCLVLLLTILRFLPRLLLLMPTRISRFSQQATPISVRRRLPFSHIPHSAASNRHPIFHPPLRSRQPRFSSPARLLCRSSPLKILLSQPSYHPQLLLRSSLRLLPDCIQLLSLRLIWATPSARRWGRTFLWLSHLSTALRATTPLCN